MGIRVLTLLVALAGFLAWVGSRRPTWLPHPILALSVEAKRGAELGAIRWSGGLLRGMGATETAPRAQMDAMLAHRIFYAVLDQLQSAAVDVRVMMIGGVIHLEGSVTSAEARDEAERVARQVSGARVVADDLRVV